MSLVVPVFFAGWITICVLVLDAVVTLSCSDLVGGSR